MINWYYKIWAEAIVKEQSKADERPFWKLYTLVPISVLMGINLFTIFYWMKIIVNKHLLLFMPVHIFLGNPLNDFVSVIITFFLPFLILNYLLVIYNERYKKIIKEYGDAKSKYYRNYALISIGILVIPIILKVAFF